MEKIPLTTFNFAVALFIYYTTRKVEEKKPEETPVPEKPKVSEPETQAPPEEVEIQISKKEKKELTDDMKKKLNIQDSEDLIDYSDMSIQHNSIIEHFKGLKLQEFIEKDAKLYFINSDCIVEEALSILSLPVFDKKKKEFIGYIDTLDILKHLVRVMPSKTDLKKDSEIERAYRALNSAKIMDVVGISGRNPYFPFHNSTPADTVFPYFASAIHRVAIIDDDNKVQASLSQTALIRTISQLLETKFKDLGKKTLKEIFLGAKPVYAVQHDTIIYNVLSLLEKKKCTAFPVVENDKLIGTFSSSDVKKLISQEHPPFNMKVKEFLEKFSPISLNVVSVKSDDSFASTVKLLTHSIHRVWVVDAHMKPKGVVSMTDIFRVIKDMKE